MVDKFAFSADWHLTPQIWSGRPQVRYDTYVGVRQLVEYLGDHNIRHLVLGGDQYDTPRPHSSALAVMLGVLDILGRAGVQVYMLPGNHCHATPEHPDILPGVINLANRTVDVCGYKLHGLPNQPGASLRASLASTPPQTDILVCHQLLDLSCPLEGMWNMQAEWVPDFVKLVLMGDYHVPSDLQAGNTRFMYPGPLAPMSMSEIKHDKQFLVVHGNTGGTPVVETVTIQSREILSPKNCEECTIADETGRRAFISALSEFKPKSPPVYPETSKFSELANREAAYWDLLDPRHITTPIIQVKYDPSIISLDDLRTAFSKFSYAWEFWPVPFRPSQEPATDADERESLDEHVILDQVVKSLGLSDEVTDFLDQLIHSDDRASVMREWREPVVAAA